MRVAIFLEIINFEHLNGYIQRVYLFDVRDTVIEATGSELLSLTTENYLLIWLLGEGVQCIYTKFIPDSVKNLIERSGIQVRNLDEIRKNPLLEAILFRTSKSH